MVFQHLTKKKLKLHNIQNMYSRNGCVKFSAYSLLKSQGKIILTITTNVNQFPMPQWFYQKLETSRSVPPAQSSGHCRQLYFHLGTAKAQLGMSLTQVKGTLYMTAEDSQHV